MTVPEIAALRALYGQPDSEPMRRQLLDLADGLHEQLHELHGLATPERAERVAISLGGAQLLILRFREAMLREIEGGATDDAA